MKLKRAQELRVAEITLQCNAPFANGKCRRRMESGANDSKVTGAKFPSDGIFAKFRSRLDSACLPCRFLSNQRRFDQSPKPARCHPPACSHQLDEDPVSITIDRPSRLISDPSSDLSIEEAEPRPRWLSRKWPTEVLATEGGINALIAFAIYLTVAILLDLKYEILPLDAVSRMANGYYVIWSRIPTSRGGRFRMEPLAVVRRHPLPVVETDLPGARNTRSCGKHRECACWRGDRAPTPRSSARMGRFSRTEAGVDARLRI